jgi:8-oxo-dGTP pyrophosphatase MutT (NUDIX family)
MAAKGTIMAGFRFRVAMQFGRSMRSPLKSARRAASSAGILMYRVVGRGLEVLLVHPGGPYWQRKDDGAWSIPKGEMDADEDAGDAARREFAEETGVVLAVAPLEPLGEIRQRAGKRVIAFAVEGDIRKSIGLNGSSWLSRIRRLSKASGPCSTGSLSVSVYQEGSRRHD